MLTLWPARLESASSISVGLGECVREQDLAGRSAVFVELADEGFEHFGIGRGVASARGRKAWLPQFWKARKKKTCTQNWPASWAMAKTSASSTVRGRDVALRSGPGRAPRGGRAAARRARNQGASAALFMSVCEVILHRLGLAGEELARFFDQFGVVGRARSRRCRGRSSA